MNKLQTIDDAVGGGGYGRKMMVILATCQCGHDTEDERHELMTV